MHSSTLVGDGGFATGGAGAWFQNVGGLVSFDSTGGAANTISGKQGLAVINGTSNGGVSIKVGADSITATSGEAVYGVAQGTGTISIDIAGATVTSGSLYGIAAIGGNGLITIGGLNGGLSGTINASSGSGIFTASMGNQSITLASSGVINALNGMTLGGPSPITVDSFGTINASNSAISGASLVTLEASSTTIGKVLGSSGSSETFSIVAGANVSSATFDGAGGNDTLNLTGGGNGRFAVASASNIAAFQKSGAGTWVLTGTTTNATPWIITGGTLSISDDAALGGSSSALTLDGGALLVTASIRTIRAITLNSGGGTLGTTTGTVFTEFGIIGGGGALTVGASAANGTVVLNSANTYTGGTTINSGANLDLGERGGLAPGSVVGAIVNNGTLSVYTGADSVFANAVSGSGSFNKFGGAVLTITNALSYTGRTNLQDGLVPSTLRLGAGGSLPSGGAVTMSGGTLDLNGHNQVIGALSSIGTAPSGILLGSGTLTVGDSTDTSFGGGIAGPGNIIKAGSGTLTLGGTSIYTGTTTISAGTLSMQGSAISSATIVSSGGTLKGSGAVGATTVQNGGALAPGNSIGTFNVVGNLSFAAGSVYAVEVSPTAADNTFAVGVASLNGTVAASVAPGSYSFGQRFTILTTYGGISGTFASLTGIPASLKGELSYDAKNAYLTLSPNALAPLLSNATSNQQSLVAAIDASVAAGNVPPAGFTALYTLSGSALNSALDQISGQAAPNVTNAVGNSFLSFMSMTMQGGSGASGNFAPGNAYGGADAPHRAQLGAGETRVWAAAYGGHVGLSGDRVSGAASLSSNNVGMVGGADMRVADGILAGVTLGLGRQLFHSGNGSGDSDDLMFGLYGRADAGAAYLAASFGFGWHRIETLRVVTVSGTDVLQGKQNADDFGGRVEAGWHVPLAEAYTVTPYAAFAGASFESPAYAETALSGASTFALSYGAQTTTLGRSELGAHLDRSYALERGVLTADIRAAWAHQLDDQPFTQATFLTLPGSAFQAAGVRPDRDTALLGLDLEIQNASGLFFGVRGEGQFGSGTTAVEGMGNFGWRW
jgi:autotransporter-associated beta strand protein